MGYNDLNQLTNRSGAGPLPVYFRGTVNQYSTVTVTNQLATLLDTNYTFEATVDLPAGISEVPVVATALNSDKTTNNYSVTVAGELGKTYAYDLNGNCTNVSMAGTNIWYEWDAENRLHAINTYVTNTATLQRSEFTYDGFDRWVQIVEKTNGAVGSTKMFVWCGTDLCQERDGGNNVQKRFFDEGEQIAGASYYFVQDQLGSVQDMVDADGYIRAQYEYDPYGNQTEVQGDMAADFGFAGYYQHAPSGLNLTVYRAYDPSQGRWLNRDPIGEDGGLNLYDYVGNSPIGWLDPYGLSPLGHHLVPKSVWNNPQTPQRIKDIWDNAKNRLDADNYKSHNGKRYGPKSGPKVKCKDYAKAVKNKLDKFLEDKGAKSVNDLTDEEAQEFADQIRDTTDGDIGAYNQGVADEIAADEAAAAEGAEAAEATEAIEAATAIDEAIVKGVKP